MKTVFEISLVVGSTDAIAAKMLQTTALDGRSVRWYSSLEIDLNEAEIFALFYTK